MANITRGVSTKLGSLINIHLESLRVALREVHPTKLIKKINFSKIKDQQTVILSIGKQAELFYESFLLKYDPPIRKAFVVEPNKDGVYYKEESNDLTVYHTSHPIASKDSFNATQEILDELDTIFAEDSNYNLVVLVTGGASASFAIPEPGISERNYIQIMNEAMSCGFQIGELNMIRGFFDSVKVGKLAARYPHIDIYTYIISDVVSDDPRIIGSAPTVAGLELSEEIKLWIKEAMKRNNITLPYEHLHEIMRIAASTDRMGKLELQIIGTRKDLLQAMIEFLRAEKMSVELATSDLKGNVFNEFQKIIDLIIERRSEIPRGYQHTLLLAGEPTIQLKANLKGRGGRVSTLAVLMSEFIAQRDDIAFIGHATDGKDGSSPHSTYIVTSQSSKHLRPLGGERKLIKLQNTGAALSRLGYGINLDESSLNLLDVYIVILS